MFYQINVNDIKEIKECVERARSELNVLFKAHERINQVPDQAIEIGKSMGKILHKLEVLSQN